jgi:hypothetical protein
MMTHLRLFEYPHLFIRNCSKGMIWRECEGEGLERRDVVGAEPSPVLILCVRYDIASLCVHTLCVLWPTGESHGLARNPRSWMPLSPEIGTQVLLEPLSLRTDYVTTSAASVDEQEIIAGRSNGSLYE